MRKLIKAIARRMGYEISRYISDCPAAPFDVLSLIVRESIRTIPHFNFVQIGANDGVTLDPIRSLVLEYRLSGLLVEPIPALYESLKANYKGQDQLKFAQCAIGPHKGTGTLYRIKHGSPLPEWSNLLASFNKQHLLRKFDFPKAEQFIEALPVPMMTMADIFQEYDICNPSLLLIDVEGFDGEVVRMTMESTVRPMIIQYEWIHLDPERRVDCKKLLVSNGYQFIDVGTDTIAIISDRSLQEQ